MTRVPGAARATPKGYAVEVCATLTEEWGPSTHGREFSRSDEEWIAEQFAKAQAEARAAAIEECAKALWDECEKRKALYRSTSIVNDKLLREIESETFRWAAQVVEACK